ncbi:MAG: hypothetical protein Q9159_001820 [Coniocarpon cinnabarinum]
MSVSNADQADVNAKTDPRSRQNQKKRDPPRREKAARGEFGTKDDGTNYMCPPEEREKNRLKLQRYRARQKQTQEQSAGETSREEPTIRRRSLSRSVHRDQEQPPRQRSESRQRAPHPRSHSRMGRPPAETMLETLVLGERA